MIDYAANTATLIATPDEHTLIAGFLHQGSPVFYSALIFLIFVSLNLTSRYLAIDYLGWESAELSALAWISDLLVGLLGASLIVLTHKFNRILALLMLLLWPALHFANLESIIALNKPIDLMDLHYATDGDFLGNSLSSLSFPLFYAFFILLLPLIIWVRRPRVAVHTGVLVALFTFSTLGSYVLATDADNWQETNPMALSVVHFINTKPHTDFVPQTLKAAHTDKQRDNDTGRAVAGIKKTTKRNVLLVVLEGIPGAYLNQVQHYFDLPRHNLMPNLSEIASRGQITPSFLTHSQQTIRGLYSMLCGDYSKQSITTPKSLEYLQLKTTQRNDCLPEILAQSGYVTSYLQAADLAFMSKDRFMPAIGFAEVNGKKHSTKQYVDFNWGPDDRAFFEQAGSKIAELRRGDQPWFLTLLTVGTHHPYAVPDEMVQDFANRKEASVAYMDNALGSFMARLTAMNVPDDTLIIFTSDESHGVPGHPYGNNWGLNVMMGPDITPAIHPGIYGLSDLSLSVLDYLGMSEQGEHFIGRSLFALYEQPRKMLFHSVMAFSTEKKGEVLACHNSGNCYRFNSDNNKLFSASYHKTKLAAGEREHIQSQLQANAYRVDTTLSGRGENTRQEWTLLSNAKFSLDNRQMDLISGGNFINVPPASRVTINLQLSADADINDRGISLSLGHRGFNGQEKYKNPVAVKNIRLPTLAAGEKLELLYHFDAAEGITHFSPELQASANGRLDIERFHVVIEHATKPAPFTVERFAILDEDGERSFAIDAEGGYLIPALYTMGQSVAFNSSGKGRGMLTQGWSNTEAWGTWSIGDDASIEFYLDPAELFTQGYRLEIKTRLYVNPAHPQQDVETFFNERSIGKQNLKHPKTTQTLSYLIPADVITAGLNRLSFKLNTPVSPKSLGLGQDNRRLGIGLHTLKILKND